MRPKPPKKAFAWVLWIDYESKTHPHLGHFYPYSDKVPTLFATRREAVKKRLSPLHSRVMRVEMRVSKG
jgi:hypothetical protein